MTFGNSIAKFMKDIGQGDRIFVFLSDKYLKSPFCMFELFEIWRTCRLNEVELTKRVRLYPLGDAKIWEIEHQLDYADYWHERFQNWMREQREPVLREWLRRTSKHSSSCRTSPITSATFLPCSPTRSCRARSTNSSNTGSMTQLRDR